VWPHGPIELAALLFPNWVTIYIVVALENCFR
jgi:hypothetical protein